MSEVRVNNLSNENNTSGPTISGITTYSGRHFFVPPVGDTVSRPQHCEPGSLRFNTDTAHLEYYKGDEVGGWVEIEAELTAPLGGGSGSNTGVGYRALFAGGGNYGSYVNDIKFLTISTLGDSEDFGDMPYNGQHPSNHVASRTRGIFAGGYGPGRVNNISFVAIASQGDAADFGDLTQKREGIGGGSNGTRGLFSGGFYNPASTNIIDHIEISSTGDAVDFGDQKLEGGGISVCSSTRWVIKIQKSTNVAMETVEMATSANTTDFGDSGDHTGTYAGVDSSTRGVMAGANGPTNLIDFITMATKGNSINFGDLSVARSSIPGGASSPTRGIFYGGKAHPSSTELDVIDFIQIATTGNAVDFGDADVARTSTGGLSNGHGGLGGS